MCACQVSLAFSDSSAVPGEQISMQLKAQPKALCAVSAVDRSVFIKEPGTRLTADKVIIPNDNHKCSS